MILTPLQKLYNNVVDLGKIIAPGFEWLPKVQKFAHPGHTDEEVTLPSQNVLPS